METTRPRIPPALVLFFLAPAIGELLSGSAPPVEFFNPFSILLLSALYGSGALLARELALRWGKRWPTILTLGLAYGIVEEGLMVKSFFDPAWMDLGLLGVYGRWAGVNWVWAVMLTLYHAVVSIAIPIMLVELIYPGQRDEPWLGRRGMRTVSILLGMDVLIRIFAPDRLPSTADPLPRHPGARRLTLPTRPEDAGEVGRTPPGRELGQRAAVVGGVIGDHGIVLRRVGASGA